MSYYYKVSQVRDIIDRHKIWPDLLARFAPELQDAMVKIGKHVSCPVHGGKHRDAFRLFKDVGTTGGGICNTCGPRNDGFEMLMWIRGWSFEDCLMAIGDHIQAPKHKKRDPAQPRPSSDAQAPKKEKAQPQSQNEPEVRQFRGKGIVMKYGRAPYQFKPKTSTSYFITLKNRGGEERSVWGVDLERSVTELGVTEGDLVSLFYLGRKQVTIVEPVIDTDGVVVEEKTITTHRNEWEIIIEQKAERPSPEAIEHVQVANGAPEPAYADADAPAWESPAESRDTPKQAQKVVPISDTPDWLAQAKERMERLAAQQARAGKKAASEISSLWNECVPLSSSAAGPAHAYFMKRGFPATYQAIAAGDDLRFHPQLDYYEESEPGKWVLAGKFPAIVAAIRDLEGNIVTLHRTFLSKNGTKAKVASPKKMMSIPDGLDVNGCAIQLGEPIDGVLGIAEGLETALSAFRATGISVWSTVNATLMKSFEVPEGVHTLLVWADLDKTRTGETAAAFLKERLRPMGIRVIVIVPQCRIPRGASGVDWNDVLKEKGLLGFPNPVRLRKFIGMQAMNESPLRKAFG